MTTSAGLFPHSGVFRSGAGQRSVFRTLSLPSLAAVGRFRDPGLPYHWLGKPQVTEQLPSGEQRRPTVVQNRTDNRVFASASTWVFRPDIRFAVTESTNHHHTSVMLNEPGVPVPIHRKGAEGASPVAMARGEGSGPQGTSRTVRPGLNDGVPGRTTRPGIFHRVTQLPVGAAVLDGKSLMARTAPARARESLVRLAAPAGVVLPSDHEPLSLAGRSTTARHHQVDRVVEAMAQQAAAGQKDREKPLEDIKRQLGQIEKDSARLTQRLDQALGEIGQALSALQRPVVVPQGRAPSYYGRLR